MFRVIPPLILGAFLASCTTTGPVIPPGILPATSPSARESSLDTTTSTFASFPDFVSEMGYASPVPVQNEPSANSQFTLKGGWYGTSDGDLDDGYIINGTFRRHLSSLFALEFEAGYFEADGGSAGIIDKSSGIPLMLNGRLNVPIWILEAYGGAGIGAFYHDVKLNSGASSDTWLFAGNAFLGADVILADKLTAGLELKYYVTEPAALGLSADALAAFLTLGLRF
jgi:hypothetical protein